MHRISKAKKDGLEKMNGCKSRCFKRNERVCMVLKKRTAVNRNGPEENGPEE
jgi:hypothetical protein